MDPKIRSMSDADYFALDAVDQTALKHYLVSPLDYATYVTGDRAPSPQFEFGKAAHSLVLGSGPVVLVKPNLRTKAGKTDYQALQEEHEGEDIVWLSDAQVKAVQAMESRASGYFTRLGGRPEMAMISQDPKTGILLKGKADWLPDEPDSDGVYRIRDYKTTSGSPEEFPRTCWTFGYEIQAAFYMRLYRLVKDEYAGDLGFEFVVQQKEPPYDWSVWRFDEHSPEVELAGQRIDHALQGIQWFNEHSHDPLRDMLTFGLSKVPRQVEFPDWKLIQLEEEVESWAPMRTV